MLFAGFVLGTRWQRAPLADVWRAMRGAAGQLGPVTLALTAMLGVSRIMVHAGMIDGLASAAAAVGSPWPVLAPAVGALGTFVTGSATASNILFTDFQQTTARTLGLPIAPMVGVQGFGAAAGNIVAPHNIIAGGATVGLSGREGEILRRTLWPCAVYTLCGGLTALLLVR